MKSPTFIESILIKAGIIPEKKLPGKTKTKRSRK